MRYNMELKISVCNNNNMKGKLNNVYLQQILDVLLCFYHFTISNS